MPRVAASLSRYWCGVGRCALLAFALGACATGTDGPFWGADATIAPGWDRLGRAALTAATDPFTWAPAIGAAALQIGEADHDIAEWANDETPIFGSRETASDASDWLRGASMAIYVGAGLGTPAPGGDWLSAVGPRTSLGAGSRQLSVGARQPDFCQRTSDLRNPALL